MISKVKDKVKLPLWRIMGQSREGLVVVEQEPEEDLAPDNRFCIPLDQEVEVEIDRNMARRIDGSIRDLIDLTDGGSENPLKEVDDKFIEELSKSIEFHQTHQDNNQGVGPAVVVSLIEVRRAFTEALKVRDSIGKDDHNHGQ